ncbi:MAG: hypothetical protein PHF00_04580 [Elusimicrobia bacterium]|nr:hypothetical protein [Elusimicrobiota bacterium]
MKMLVWALAAVFLFSLTGMGCGWISPWTALFLPCAAALLRLRRREGENWLERRPGRALFLLCLTAYLSTFRWHGGDDIPNSLLPYSLLGHGTLTFDPFPDWAARPNMRDLVRLIDGHWISSYPVVPGLLASPLYLIPVWSGAAPTDDFLHNLAKIGGAAITALSVAILYRALRERCSARWAAAVALLYGLGSYAFSVSSQALYSHGPAQLGVALALLGISSAAAWGPAAAGLGLGLATVSREDSALFLAAGAAYFLFHRREGLARFLAAAAAPIALNLAYWLYATGTLRPPYFETQRTMFVPLDARALAGMLASPGRGLAFFFPAAGFALWGIFRAARDPGRRWAPYLAAACAALWIFYGLRDSWTGGNSFGNRYFSVSCLVLAFFCGEIEDSVRGSRSLSWAWAVCFSVCVLVHALGAYFNWPGAKLTLGEQAEAIWSPWQFPPLHIFSRDGALGGLGWAARAALGLGLLALTVPATVWMRRFVAGRAEAGALQL